MKGDSDTPSSNEATSQALSSNETTSKALTSNDSTSKATTDNRDLEYDDASREYLGIRGHMMSGSNKRHTSNIHQMIEEEKEKKMKNTLTMPIPSEVKMTTHTLL